MSEKECKKWQKEKNFYHRTQRKTECNDSRWTPSTVVLWTSPHPSPLHGVLRKLGDLRSVRSLPLRWFCLFTGCLLSVFTSFRPSLLPQRMRASATGMQQWCRLWWRPRPTSPVAVTDACWSFWASPTPAASAMFATTQASTRIVRRPVFVSHEQPDAPRM